MSRPTLSLVNPPADSCALADTQLAIDARGLSKRFILTGGKTDAGYAPPGLFSRGKGNEFWAVRNLSFKLNRGERLGVMGQNGAGKSVLLKMLSRVLDTE